MFILITLQVEPLPITEGTKNYIILLYIILNLCKISIHTVYIISSVICWGKSTKPEHTGAERGGDFVVEGQKQYSTGPVSCQRMLLAMLLWKHSWPAKIVTGFTLPSGAQQGQRYRALRRGVPT